MDRAADSFAILLSSAAKELMDPVRKRIMEQILYHLGRWIYLIDGADDLKKDAESGNYNPVALRYGLADGTWTPESRRDFATTLDHSIHQMAAAFELWDFGVWTPVLQLHLLRRGCFRWEKPCWTADSIAPAERISERLRKPNERSIRGPGSSPDRHR